MKGRSIVPLWRSIQTKYAIAYLFVFLVVLVFINTYPVVMAQNMVFRSKQTAMQGQAAVIGSSLAGLEELTGDGVGQVMALLDDMDLSRILVTDEAGLILYDTREAENGVGRYALLQEVQLALSGSDVFTAEYRGEAFLSRAASPVVYHGMVIGAVYVYQYDSEQGSLLRSLQNSLRSGSVVIFAAVILLSIFFSRFMTMRLNRLLGAIRTLREGKDDTARVAMPGNDELAALGREFDCMAERIKATDEMRRRFVSDASHELKTPLASIRLLTDSILQSPDMDQKTLHEFVGDIGEEADRLTRITEKLLSLTRMDNHVERQLVRVDLQDTLEKTIHLLAPVAAKRHISLRRSGSSPCMVLAVEDDLYQVFFNLMENGIKYNVDGGYVHVTLKREGPMAVLLVEDSGVGIPPEDRERIFERFYRVDKARSREAGGTGLGLSIVRDTVRSYGGTITVDSGKDGGSCFRVELPAEEEEA